MSRRILHVDMDAFFASVEQRDFPELRGKPVIVGGKPNERGVVAAASYEARKFGVHSAMPTAKAVKLCPDLIIQRHRFELYKEISTQIREIFYSYTNLVQPLSLDEAFLDVSETYHQYGSAQEIGKEIKARIQQETKLTCSVGVAPNKFLAKIASDFKKPDGFVVIRPNRVEEFLTNLPVSKIWGVGHSTESKLHAMNIHTIGQLTELSLTDLIDKFGKWGARLYELARGIDDRPVDIERETKSVSRETTFAKDIYDINELRKILNHLAERVHQDLNDENLQARTIHIKIRFPDFTTITRSHTLKEPTSQNEIIQEAAWLLMKHKVEDLSNRGARLIGVGVSNFVEGTSQLSLLDEMDEESLESTLEDLRHSFE